jgi:hypothetical protein
VWPAVRSLPSAIAEAVSEKFTDASDAVLALTIETVANADNAEFGTCRA